MCAWNSSWPVGNISVKDNRTKGNQNTTYIEDTMGNVVVGTNAAGTTDHFWDVSGDLDGHHRFIKSPAFTSSDITKPDPVLGTGIDGVVYLKQKLAADAPDFQPVVPFFKDAQVTPNILEMLGIRACALFTADGTVKYAHNVASVVNDSTGQYTITYTTALPSNNYLVLAGCSPNESAATRCGVAGIKVDTTQGNVKSTTKVVIICRQLENSTTQLVQPHQGWVVCFGG